MNLHEDPESGTFRGAPTYEFEGFRLDAQHRVLYRATGEPIPLPPKAIETLLHLVDRPGEVQSRQALLDAIWPGLIVEENNLSQCISLLRRVLGETPSEHRFIVTEPGRGYRFVAAVRVLDEAPANPREADDRTPLPGNPREADDRMPLPGNPREADDRMPLPP